MSAPETTLTRVMALRRDLLRSTKATDVLDVAERAAQAKRVYEAIGRSVDECNQFAGLYLEAYWKFGDLVMDIPQGRPEKKAIDGPFPGTTRQRKYARELCAGVPETAIPDYVQSATEAAEPATIAGCLAWMHPERPHVSHNSGENEWYTPAELIEAARAVMGGIDLDPASSATANQRVGAAVFFDMDTNGLIQPWHGRVWLNPPYAQPLVQHFIEAVATKFDAREIAQACVLVNNATDTGWFHRLLASASAVCFLKGRVRFLDPDGAPSGAPLQGQAVLYLGPSRSVFVDHFTPFGAVLVKP